jgi:hypothetical protein
VAELEAIDTNTWLRKSPEERARLMAEANALVGR